MTSRWPSVLAMSGEWVDEVVGVCRVSAMVEELDAEIAVEREHPVAHLVGLDGAARGRRGEREVDDGAQVDAALARGAAVALDIAAANRLPTGSDSSASSMGCAIPCRGRRRQGTVCSSS